MASSPKWKVYRNNEYVASCKWLEDAAMLMQGEGDEIRLGHNAKRAVWREGFESQSACESYDHVAAVCSERAGLVPATT